MRKKKWLLCERCNEVINTGKHGDDHAMITEVCGGRRLSIIVHLSECFNDVISTIINDYETEKSTMWNIKAWINGMSTEPLKLYSLINVTEGFLRGNAK